MVLTHNEKILVVDDEKKWLVTISHILQPDYDLTLKTDPFDALEAFKTNSYSLVILDMKLQGMTGIELFSKMQEVSEEIRAIILTGYPDYGTMRRSFKSGFLDYLEKSTLDLFTDLREAVSDALKRDIHDDISSLLQRGEGEDLEFKSTARWDVRASRVNRDLEKVIVKTIAGFLNSTKGGVALIGVDDSGTIIGLELDYETLSKKNRDGYENFLNNLLLNAFGKDIGLFLHLSFHEIQGKDVCRIDVRPSTKPVFVVEEKSDLLYIRVGNSTRSLSTRETIDYVKNRWPS